MNGLDTSAARVSPDAAGVTGPASDVQDALSRAIDVARAAAVEVADGDYRDAVGEHLGTHAEQGHALAHRFSADLPGYRGWEWVVVVAAAGPDAPVTVSEVVLLPGTDALVAPAWVPWHERVRPGDLAPGDLLPPAPGDHRLVPGYVANGDPEVDELAREVGLGRKQVMSREGRLEAAERWHAGDHGPDTEMARSAASCCALCGFYLPLAGALHRAFGVCGNEFAEDGQVVHAEYGCGAHSDTTLPGGAGSPAYEPYDDGAVERVPESALRTAPAAEPKSETASDAPHQDDAESAAPPQ